MNTAKVTNKGQVTIPKRARSLIAIETGDRLAFDLDENGSLRVSRVRGEGPPLRGLLSAYVKDGIDASAAQAGAAATYTVDRALRRAGGFSLPG